mgnify:CR=1 FL=1
MNIEQCHCELYDGDCSDCNGQYSTCRYMIKRNCQSSKPYKCPICNGTGLVSRPPYIAGDVSLWSASNQITWGCPACKGAKIIWSQESSND